MHPKLRPDRHTAVRSLILGLTALATFVRVCVATSPVLADQASCQNPGNVLGVSRVVEIETTPGPRYGLQQYKDNDFLKPGEIVLTFDDGPLRPHTQPILNALDAQCTKATFFMVGSQAIADPEMVKRIIAKGHTVGSHTWSHANLQKSTPLKARQEIELGLSAVTAAAGQPVAPFFRFPYLAHTKSMLGYTQSRGFGVFSIDVDSRDWKTHNAASVQHDVLAQLAELGKGIILMHDIQPATAQALPALLEALRLKGYKVVQLRSKSVATTIPEFDALARNANARNQVAAVSQPLARRSMTWGSADPTVLAHAPPVALRRGTYGSAAVAPSSSETAGRAESAAIVPATGAMPVPSAPATSSEPPPQPARVAHDRSPPANDWRDTIFSR